MKKLFALVIAGALSFVPFFSQAQIAQLPPLVSVAGQGEVKVQPDQIVFTVGVEVREKTLEEARKAADQRTSALLNALKKSGVDEKQTQSAYLSLQPIYTGDYIQTAPTSYMATRTISVTLNKLDKFDEVMSNLYKAGANRVDGISFQSSQLKKYQEEARKKAVQDAKQKATSLASELNAKVGRVYSINEGGANTPSPIYMAKARMSEAMMADGGSTLAAGQITITSSVDVSFILE